MTRKEEERKKEKVGVRICWCISKLKNNRRIVHWETTTNSSTTKECYNIRCDQKYPCNDHITWYCANCKLFKKIKNKNWSDCCVRPLVLLTFVHNNSIHNWVTKKLAEYIVNEYCINSGFTRIFMYLPRYCLIYLS